MISKKYFALLGLIAPDKKEFTCVINGGNLPSFGMTNPPQCNRKNG